MTQNTFTRVKMTQKGEREKIRMQEVNLYISFWHFKSFVLKLLTILQLPLGVLILCPNTNIVFVLIIFKYVICISYSSLSFPFFLIFRSQLSLPLEVIEFRITFHCSYYFFISYPFISTDFCFFLLYFHNNALHFFLF